MIGIPRHEAQWLANLEAAHSGSDFYKNRQFIFIIGRPSNEKYHPRERKIKALQDIRKMAEKYDLDVVVKTHPKEHDDAT